MERELLVIPVFLDFSGGSDNKESACSVGDLGSILELVRSPGKGMESPGEGIPIPVFLTGESHGWRSLVGFHL